MARPGCPPAARALVREGFGEAYLGPEAKGNVATGPTQDAHEAIRPTRLQVEDPSVDDEDARRLYRLIRARTLASQMRPATGASLSIEAECEGLDRPLTTSIAWRTFPGWEAAYREFEPQRPTAPPEIPLTAGVVAGGAVTILAPVLAALGALAALLSEFRVEVIRTDQPDGDDD